VRLTLVLGVVGHLLRLFGLAFAPPLALALADAIAGAGPIEAGLPFLAAGVAASGTGLLLVRWFTTTPGFRRSEALGTVAATWLALGLFGAIPFLFYGLSPVDAFFEAMSGFTTTGATILAGEGWQQDRAFFLWRAMTQWFGGLGIIALFVVVLPRLGIAGRQLFFAEASTAPSEAVSPQIRQSARRLWILYGALTAVLAVLLGLAGYPAYEALLHSLTTLSAGGFSPHPESVAGYANPVAEWILLGFMILAGTSFTLQYRAFTGRPLALLRDPEFVTYVGVILLATLGLSAILSGGAPDLESLRTGGFQVASLMSSTGYGSADFAAWSDAAKAVLLLVMLVGACAGSAGGGPKVIRWVLTARFLRRELTQVLHPRAVLPLRYQRALIPPPILRAVLTLVFLYLGGYVLLGVLVQLLEPQLDLATTFSMALASLGNIGPAFGPAGPMGSYANLGDATKVALALSMWIGRLEIVTVIALLHPDVWRHLRWHGDVRPPRPPARPGPAR
jgi:trk system potassium uptake protein TrkH